ncbi:hypothetical protein SmJEL517_g04401 [Synchytrium microbalum]|uniref:CBF1-interacting co-repressor CIR N-terminal domain-containing protein n=1 Tax=Synchytrium microbalum TaxID=1806994 RepID=A0A507BYL0_9FUNG|nr:uncharacterized protein SmJEL517_g04401 [Synchytrium microbalum]TPX32502.1 hypothetical protein SmJEL517_g04401 [Synchytrium microbalum]
MGGGDLNLKKSWHPATLRNIEKVWKLERKADDEKKKLDQLRKEKEEERQLAELQELQEAAGLRKRSERLDWMYAAGPSGNASLVAEEKEAYLLGKKRVDKFSDAAVQSQQLVPEATLNDKFDSTARLVYGMTANTIRDTQSKIREDPFLAIKKREQASIQAVMSNPIRTKKLKEELGIDDSDKKKKKKHKKDKKRHHSDDDDDNHSDDGGSKRKRRRSDSIEDRFKRESSPSTRERSPLRRERSPPRRERSPPPYAGRAAADLDSRRDDSRSRYNNSNNGHLVDDDRRDRYKGSREYTNGASNRDYPRRDDYSRRDQYDDRNNHSNSNRPPPPPTRLQPQRPKDDEYKKKQEEERQAKIAAMMEAADSHELERKQRVYSQKQAEQAEDAVDDEARKKRLKESGSMGQGFSMDMHRSVYNSANTSGSDMIKRNRAFAQKGDADFLSK